MTTDAWDETAAADYVAPEPSRTPVAKVQAAGAAGALATLLVWVLGAFCGVVVPAETAAALAGVLAFAAGYLKRG